jgi:predicted  nucleic acid-binding Zn-ribbon protein
MGELGQLDGLIKSLQTDKTEKQQSIDTLQGELDNINKQQIQLASEATKKNDLLTAEKKGLSLLEDTISETTTGYNKIIESTRALLSIISSKPK